MLRLHIKVKPNARQNTLVEQTDGTWLAHIKAPPVDGKANQALIALIAAHWGIHKSQVSIKSGGSARIKQVILDC